MTSPEDLAARERERDAFLLAFYALTVDEPLRWSTHRTIGTYAAIPEDRIMIVSQQLAQMDLVKPRTMGGLDGYVELTPLGVHKAEELIRSADEEPAEARVPSSGPDADKEWVQRFRLVVVIAFEAFANEGEWPDIDTLQRAIDRTDLEVDVSQAIQELPRAPGEATALRPFDVQPATTGAEVPAGGPICAGYLFRADPSSGGCLLF